MVHTTYHRQCIGIKIVRLSKKVCATSFEDIYETFDQQISLRLDHTSSWKYDIICQSTILIS